MRLAKSVARVHIADMKSAYGSDGGWPALDGMLTVSQATLTPPRTLGGVPAAAGTPGPPDISSGFSPPRNPGLPIPSNSYAGALRTPQDRWAFVDDDSREAPRSPRGQDANVAARGCPGGLPRPHHRAADLLGPSYCRAPASPPQGAFHRYAHDAWVDHSQVPREHPLSTSYANSAPAVSHIPRAVYTGPDIQGVPYQTFPAVVPGRYVNPPIHGSFPPANVYGAFHAPYGSHGHPAAMPGLNVNYSSNNGANIAVNSAHRFQDVGNSYAPDVPGTTSEGVSHLTAHVANKQINSALCGEFLDLQDLLDHSGELNNELKSVVDSYGNVSFRTFKNKKMITSPYKWLEAWGLYEVILGRVHGYSVIHEMISYNNFILNLFQRFKIAHVLNYDCRHRRRLAAHRSFSFAKINYDVYIDCFDATALRSTIRCSRCSSADHDQVECPFRPSSPATSDPFPNKKVTRSVATEICKNFQDGKCKFGKRCHRRHVCAGCGGSEGQSSCVICQKSKTSS